MANLRATIATSTLAVLLHLLTVSEAAKEWTSLASTFGGADNLDWVPDKIADWLKDKEKHSLGNLIRFQDLPTSADAAGSKNPKWELLPGGAGECCGAASAGCSKMFRGRRFWTKYQAASAKDEKKSQSPLSGQYDPALILVFNVKGTLAAIQSAVLKTDFEVNDPNVKFTYAPPADGPLRAETIDGKEYYTMTAYLDDPDNICDDTKAKAPDTIATNGIGGDHLYFQNGDTPAARLVVPYKETELAKDADNVPAPTKWVRGQCFPGMGQHFWWRLKKGMDPNNFFNFFPLYNPDRTGQGTLLGFGFSVNVDMKSSRYEHPDVGKLALTMRTVPDFFSTDPAFTGRISSMHIYLRSDMAAFWKRALGPDGFKCISRNRNTNV